MSSSLSSGFEPLEEIRAFIRFDPQVYTQNAGIRVESDEAAFEHFEKKGRLDRVPVRLFRESDLFEAVRFSESSYLRLNPDVKAAGGDAWRHFCDQGLRERRRVCREEGDFREDLLRCSIDLDIAADIFVSLTPAEKLRRVSEASPARLSEMVRRYLSQESRSYYRESIALLLVQACLALQWPLAAACFVSAYWEGIPFCIPRSKAPLDEIQVYPISSLRAYCDSRGVSVSVLRTEQMEKVPTVRCLNDRDIRGSAHTFNEVVICELTNARVNACGGDIITQDRVLIPGIGRVSGKLLGDEPMAFLTGPTHATAMVPYKCRSNWGRVLSFLDCDGEDFLHTFVEVLPRLAFAMRSGFVMEGSARYENLAERALVSIGKKVSELSRRIRYGQLGLLLPKEKMALYRSILQPFTKGNGTFSIGRLHAVKAARAVSARRLLCVSDVHSFASESQTGDKIRRRVISADALRWARDLAGIVPEEGVAGRQYFVADNVTQSGLVNARQIAVNMRGLGIEAEFLNRDDLLEASRRLAEVQFAIVDFTLSSFLLFCSPGAQILLLAPNQMSGLRIVATIAEAACLELEIFTGLAVGGNVRSTKTDGYLIDTPELLRLLSEERWDTKSLEVRCKNLVGDIEASVIAAVPDVELAFERLHQGGQKLTELTRSVGYVLSSKILDLQCIEIGESMREQNDTVYTPKPGRRVRLFYATILLRAGGHTRVIEDIINALPNDEHHIMFDIQPRDDLDSIVRTTVRPHFHHLCGTASGKLLAAFDIAEKIRPDTLFHVANPEDPVGTAMLQPGISGKLVMLHHNDHSFAFGRYAEHVTHVAVHKRARIALEKMLERPVALLPLTTRTVPNILQRSEYPTPLITVTSGTINKFQPYRGRSHMDMLRARFMARSGIHFHIGELSLEELEAIRGELDRMGGQHRFVHIPFVPSLVEAFTAIRPDIYMNSYPVGGGRALVEAMAVGLPIVTASHDPILDGAFMVYDECLKWRHADELIECLRNFSGATLDRHRHLSRNHYERQHAPDVFRAALMSILESSISDK